MVGFNGTPILHKTGANQKPGANTLEKPASQPGAEPGVEYEYYYVEGEN